MPNRVESKKLGLAQAILAIVIVVGFFAVLIFLFYARDPSNTEGFRDARLIMIGALTSGLSLVLGFYFGTTASSERKTELLANSTPTPTDPVTVTTTSVVAEDGAPPGAPNLPQEQPR